MAKKAQTSRLWMIEEMAEDMTEKDRKEFIKEYL